MLRRLLWAVCLWVLDMGLEGLLSARVLLSVSCIAVLSPRNTSVFVSLSPGRVRMQARQAAGARVILRTVAFEGPRHGRGRAPNAGARTRHKGRACSKVKEEWKHGRRTLDIGGRTSP